MWHEVRRQEKKIRGMMVDYRKRAERRRDFYEKFFRDVDISMCGTFSYRPLTLQKADPTQFLQLHGRPCKIHLDANIAAAGDSASVMMQWQGRPDLLIDRFDVRAHLDFIQEHPPSAGVPDSELSYDERHLNYERYRILVQNDYLGVEEEKFLHQIYLEEQFGPIALKQNTEGIIEKKEKDKRKGAAIGFTYDDPGSSTIDPSQVEKGDESDSDDSELDFDLCLDLSEVDTASAHELNHIGQRFGLVSNDFYSFLTNDVEEQESLRMAREQEEEKAMYSGRKARRERQAFRERRLAGRVMSPPSYAERKSPVYDKFKSSSKSRSRSVTPENTGAITYITSFGDEEVVQDVAKPQISLKKTVAKRRRTRSSSRSTSSKSKSRSRTPVNNRIASKLSSNSSRHSARRSRSSSQDSEVQKSRKLPNSPDRRYERSRPGRRWSRSRSRSRSRGRHDRRSRSRSRHRYRRRSRTRSRSPPRRRFTRSRSRSRSLVKHKDREQSHIASSTSQTSKTESAPSAPRYYGRNRKDSSSSIEVSSGEEMQESTTSTANSSKNETGRSGATVGGRFDSRPEAKSTARETQQEKLKRRMQALLNKQFKQDKRLEREKAEKAERERLDRAAELRDISIRIRRRERYLRHLGDKDRRSISSRSSDDDSAESPPPSRYKLRW